MSQITFIEENLNNLGALDIHDFRYLSEHIKQFYDTDIFSEQALHYIQRLFTILSEENFPNKFNLTEIKITYTNDGLLCFINKFGQICYEEDNELYITPLLTKVNGQIYYNTQKKILEGHKKNKDNDNVYWKTQTYSSDAYNTDCNNFTFDEDCAVSIYDDVYILHVLKATNINNIKDIDLLKQAVSLGGKMTHSYKDDFYRYVSYGFLPISVCKWDDELAPINWIKLNGFKNNNWKQMNDTDFKYKRQDIIFYIYTGLQYNINNYDDWVANVGYSDSFDKAQDIQYAYYNKLLEEN